jgi:hypothetical protein
MTNLNPNTDQANTPDKSANRPTYEALIPVTGENGETSWQKIGAAWTAAKQNGFNLVLTELPFVPDGKQTIYLRPRKAAPAAPSQAASDPEGA